ncbi:hypothetical protein L4D06_08400 [Enterovibrio makurazakiensis]|uniref:Lipoprotein n=1 Tax=Enterovibrio gelatinilyticus TaxID=2899819 RepID=A0ABT5QUH8_9GAMM|nr:hypothetical protein [Enterovibrio sp. ZSDZ42]MDD1791595.1 hypothetical protein [Enterovibrio sp. ZSDZ42]
MKRISLVFVLAIFLFGCNDENNISTTPSSPNQEQEPEQDSGNDSADKEKQEDEEQALSESPAEVIKRELEQSYLRHAPNLDRDSSLTGTDNNGNGVRDDIDVIINDITSDTPIKEALVQVATSYQKELTVDWGVLSDEEAKSMQRTLFSDMSKASQCLGETLGAGFSGPSRILKALTYNTKNRSLHFIKSNSIADGMAFTVGGFEDACE